MEGLGLWRLGDMGSGGSGGLGVMGSGSYGDWGLWGMGVVGGWGLWGLGAVGAIGSGGSGGLGAMGSGGYGGLGVMGARGLWGLGAVGVWGLWGAGGYGGLGVTVTGCYGVSVGSGGYGDRCYGVCVLWCPWELGAALGQQHPLQVRGWEMSISPTHSPPLRGSGVGVGIGIGGGGWGALTRVGGLLPPAWLHACRQRNGRSVARIRIPHPETPEAIWRG